MRYVTSCGTSNDMVDVLIGIHSQHDRGIDGVTTDTMVSMIKCQINGMRFHTDIRGRASLGYNRPLLQIATIDVDVLINSWCVGPDQVVAAFGVAPVDQGLGQRPHRAAARRPTLCSAIRRR